MIKAISFDYDGVLTTDKTGSLTTNRYLSRALGVEFSKVKAAFGGYNKDLTLGKKTHAQIWPEVCSAMGCDLSISLLYEAFESTPVNAGVFSLVHELKGNYSLGIITDNKKDRIDHLKKKQNLESLFNLIVISSEVGASKESSAIFQHALSRLNLKPQECVFIDNDRDNLVAPDALGIKTVFHDDERNDIGALVRALKGFGVVIGNAHPF